MEKSDYRLSDLIESIIKYKKILALVLMITVISSTALNLLFIDDKHTATAVIQYSPVIAPEEYDKRANPIIEVVKSDSNVNESIKLLNLNADKYTINYVRSIVAYTSDNLTNTMRISVTDNNETNAKAIANQFAYIFAREFSTRIVSDLDDNYDQQLSVFEVRIETNQSRTQLTEKLISQNPQIIEGEINPIYVDLVNKLNALTEELMLVKLEENRFKELHEKKYDEFSEEYLPQLREGKEIAYRIEDSSLDVYPSLVAEKTNQLSRVYSIISVCIVTLIIASLAIILREYLQHVRLNKREETVGL